MALYCEQKQIRMWHILRLMMIVLAVSAGLLIAAEPARAATYDYQWLTQSYATPTTPDSTGQLSVTVKNTGTATWRKDGSLNSIKLGTYRPLERSSAIYDGSWQSATRVGYFTGRAQLDGNGQPVRDGGGNVIHDTGATTIAPGEAAHFAFTVKTPNRPYAAGEYFNLVIEGVTWLPDVGMHWPVNIGQGYGAQWVGQSSYPSIDKGTNPIGSASFDYLNTGTYPWQKNGVVRLGTSRSRDRVSSFATSDLSGSSSPALPANTANWHNFTRPGTFAGKVSGGSLDTSATVIQPGETARFTVALDGRGIGNNTYREYFQVVADGFAWMTDYGAFMDVTVSTSAPKVGAAGDIACDTSDPDYNGGSGNAAGCRQIATSDLLVGAGYAKVLAIGDLQYDTGELTDFNQSYESSWGRVKNITAPVPGNHEYETAAAAGYYAYFGGAAGDPTKGYYSFDVGDWHLIALNSNCSQVGGCQNGSTQETWLQADLAANSDKCTLAYWHHPRWSSGAHGDDSRTADFWHALQNGGADVILTGHDHDYERFHRQTPHMAQNADGLRQFVVGSGGREFRAFTSNAAHSAVRNASAYGVLEMTLNSHSYDWNFRPIAGQSFSDSGSTACR